MGSVLISLTKSLVNHFPSSPGSSISRVKIGWTFVPIAIPIVVSLAPGHFLRESLLSRGETVVQYGTALPTPEATLISGRNALSTCEAITLYFAGLWGSVNTETLATCTPLGQSFISHPSASIFAARSVRTISNPSCTESSLDVNESPGSTTKTSIFTPSRPLKLFAMRTDCSLVNCREPNISTILGGAVVSFSSLNFCLP